MTQSQKALLNSCIAMSNPEFDLIRKQCTFIKSYYVGQHFGFEDDEPSTAEVFCFSSERWEKEWLNNVYFYVRFRSDWSTFRVEDISEVKPIILAARAKMKEEYDIDQANAKKKAPKMKAA